MSEVVGILTSKQEQDLVAIGGAGWWKLDAKRARRASHVLLCHNAHDERRLGDPEMHGKAFLLGTIREVVQDAEDPDARWLIKLDAFKRVLSGFEWPGYRNPVTYLNGEEVLGQLALEDEWQSMEDVPLDVAMKLRREDDPSVPSVSAHDGGMRTTTFSAIIAHHRSEIAAALGVSPSQVTISVSA